MQWQEDLWRKKISPEQMYLEAKKASAGAWIELRAAEQKLSVLGFAEMDLSQLPLQQDTALTQHAITAPFDGTVIEKHITLGEWLKDGTVAYMIADLGSVWVHLSVYPKDLPFVRTGQLAASYRGLSWGDSAAARGYPDRPTVQRGL